MHEKIKLMKESCQQWLELYETLSTAEQAAHQARYKKIEGFLKLVDGIIPSEATTTGIKDTAKIEGGVSLLEIIKGIKAFLPTEMLA